jgi:sugar phosphate isomerase/epimerase
MSLCITRRNFLATTGAVAGMGLAGLGHSGLLAAEPAIGAPNADKLGWRLGCQAWSFKDVTLFEAIDKTASLGLHYIEIFPKQSLSQAQPNILVTENLPAESRKAIKQKLGDAGVTAVGYGVCLLSKDAAVSRKTFEFAKDMGIETIVSEPAEDAFDTLEKLCEQYQINLAIHDHSKPTHYWNPDTVLKVCKDRSERIGACADTGHWAMSGLNPIECLKKLEGRLITFHLKDLNEIGGRKAHDVPWGTGVCDVKGMLTEIHRQGVKGVFSIEYEYNFGHSMPEITQCIAYFDKVAAELGGQS